MKTAVFLHGTDGNPDNFWFPWLKERFSASGYAVFSPLLPLNHTPNKESYSRFLRDQDVDYEDAVFIGHSSGATAVLNILSEEWVKHVRAAILVGAFLNEKYVKSATWYEDNQFDDLFPALPFDINKLKSKADNYYFVHGDDDPFCGIDDARELCDGLGGTFITVANGHHLAGTSGITEIPLLDQVLKHDKIIV